MLLYPPPQTRRPGITAIGRSGATFPTNSAEEP